MFIVVSRSWIQGYMNSIIFAAGTTGLNSVQLLVNWRASNLNFDEKFFFVILQHKIFISDENNVMTFSYAKERINANSAY